MTVSNDCKKWLNFSPIFFRLKHLLTMFFSLVTVWNSWDYFNLLLFILYFEVKKNIKLFKWDNRFYSQLFIYLLFFPLYANWHLQNIVKCWFHVLFHLFLIGIFENCVTCLKKYIIVNGIYLVVAHETERGKRN